MQKGRVRLFVGETPHSLVLPADCNIRHIRQRDYMHGVIIGLDSIDCVFILKLELYSHWLFAAIETTVLWSRLASLLQASYA